MLTEEKINLNYLNFISKLRKYNCYPAKMEDDNEFNVMLANASAFTKEDTGGAYAGSLIEHITRIAVIAHSINEKLSEEVKVPIESLIKVCYLHQISKCKMIIENTVQFEIKKGKLFTFIDDVPALKCGEYSAYICAKYGIDLTEDEYEAILSIDKRDDDQTKGFGCMLGQILRASIDLANTERKLKYKHYAKVKN